MEQSNKRTKTDITLQLPKQVTNADIVYWGFDKAKGKDWTSFIVIDKQGKVFRLHLSETASAS